MRGDYFCGAKIAIEKQNRMFASYVKKIQKQIFPLKYTGVMIAEYLSLNLQTG